LAALLIVLGGLGAVSAQDTTVSENSALIRYIESSLSSEDRIIRFENVTGALSSEARIGAITIADRQGIWLRITGAEIVWTRSALLARQLRVNALKAEKIEILRRPVAATPAFQPESAGFSLPELPVEVNLTGLDVASVELAEPVLGVAARLKASGALRLDATGLSASFTSRRLDPPGGEIDLALDYARLDQALNIQIKLDEPANGLLANALSIEQRPALGGRISGSGTLADMAVGIDLRADGRPFVSGTVTFNQSGAGQVFKAAINGQLAPLLPQDYRGFFAGDSRAAVEGTLRTEGGLDLPSFQIETANLNVTGSLTTAKDGFPSRLALAAQVGRKDGALTTLPFGGSGYRLAIAAINADFGADAGGTWHVRMDAKGFQAPGFGAARVKFDATGQAMDLETQDLRAVKGVIAFEAEGLTAEAADIAAALGQNLRAGGGVDWSAGQPLKIVQMQVNGESIALNADGGLALNGFSGHLDAAVSDLRAFNALAPSRDLSGRVAGTFDGRLNPLDGQIDGTLQLTGQDIALGVARIDRILKGPLALFGQVRRDAGGIRLGDARLRSGVLDASADGFVSSAAMALHGRASITDLGLIAPTLRGPATAGFDADGPLAKVAITAKLQGDAGLSLAADGSWGDRADLRATFKNLPLDLMAELRPDIGATGSATGELELSGDPTAPDVAFDVQASNANADLLLPYKLGPLDGAAKGVWKDGQLTFNRAWVAAQGGLSAQAKGTVPLSGGLADLHVSGALPLVLVNDILANPQITLNGGARFDLHVSGPLAAPVLNGPVDLENTAVTVPGIGMRIEKVNTRVQLVNGIARFSDVTANIAAGGVITASGSVGVFADMPVDASVSLNGVKYADGAFLTTSVSGQVSLQGDIAHGVTVGGQVKPDVTEITLSAAVSAGNSLAQVNHIHAGRGVLQTLSRAGLGERTGRTAAAATGLNLDMTISAPNRIFVRGRGLDAELGGEIVLTGPMEAVSAAGQFDLIRGRLDLLGRRLDLTEGTLTFSGPMDPTIAFSSQTKADGTDITLALDGVASAPEITLRSVPDLPQDEILAKLIFGRDLGNLSPFQIASLAAAVAELSGRTDSGLIEKLRQTTGLDNLDIRTNDAGQSAGVVGKYLSDKIYSEIEIDSGGTANVTINLDITKSLKAQGGVGSSGSGSLGLFFEKDY